MNLLKKQQSLFVKVASVLILFIMIQAPLQANALSLQGLTSYSVGDIPNGMTSADFNGDGKIDIAVANVGSDSVSVRLGIGDGTFGNKDTYASGDYTYSIANGDFNGDGKIDLATANSTPGTASIYLGNGDGTFGSESTVTLGGSPNYIAVADLNGDSLMDLIVSNRAAATVFIVLGNGDGTFGAVSSAAVGAGPYEVVTGDFNGDSKIDLAVPNISDNDVSVLLGNGDGTFAPKVDYAVQLRPLGSAIGDINKDGYLDLVVSNTNSGSLSILLGKGDGTFHAAVHYDSGGDDSRGVVIGDFTGDGVVDVATGNFGSGTISVLEGDGSGSFAAAITFNTSSALNDLVGEDFNGDGQLDFAFTRQGENDFGVRLATSNNARLQSLNLSGGAMLSPAFSTGINSYTSSVTYNVYNVTATPRAHATATMTVRVNGGTPEAVAGGGASSALALNVGANTIDVVVTAQDGTTKQTYTSVVTRLPNTDANLSGLSLSGGAVLSPAFSTGTNSYTSSVGYNVSNISVTPIAHATATMTVRVNGGTPEAVAGGGTSSALALNVGANTIDVVVTAQDGTTKKTYTSVVTRLPNTDANLSGLSLSGGAVLSPAFSTGINSYTASVDYNVSNISVTPIAHATAIMTVRVNGGTPEVVASGDTSSALALNVGANTIDVVVTAQDGTTKQTYTSVVTRQQPEIVTIPLNTNASLNDLSLSGGAVLNPAFSKDTLNYTLGVAHNENNISVTPTLEDRTATVTVQLNSDAPQAVITGQASGVLPLSVGTNTISVTVKAQDGTLKVYTLTITREADKEIMPPVSTCAFTDIANHWARTEICEAAALGIVDGVRENIFAPENAVTRTEFAVMLLRTLQIPISQQPAVFPFSDKESIPEWAQPAIYTGVTQGFLHGYTDGTFGPQLTINRSEMAAMIAKAMKWETSGEQYRSFSDHESIPVWAHSYVGVVYEQGLLQGRGGNKFVPEGTTTRAEAAVAMLRLWKVLN